MTNEVKVLKSQDKDFLLTKLADTIRRNEKHIDYERVVELNTLYTQLITGENMDSLLKQFTPRESPELFRQRMRITQHITKTVSQNIMDIYQKIPRSNSVSRVVTYSDNNIAKLNEFNTKLNEFWGDESLDDYMATRWFELNFIDPNAFIVAEWLNVDTTKERYMPYPFEVSSKMAINYEYFNNDLIYLISEMPKSITYWDKKEKRDVTITIKEYTIYGANQTIKFKQLSPKESEQAWKDNKVAINAALREGIFIIGDYFVPDVNKDDIYLIILSTPHNLSYVPAVRVGYSRDLYKNGRTCVSPMDEAVPILMKMVKANSEFDLTMALHAFPQKIQYVSKCKATDCRDGQTVDGGGVCSHCNGSGYEIITSAQDTITLAMPKTKEEQVDLANIIRYEYPPVDLVKFQDAYIDKLIMFVKEAIFKSETFSKKEISETATGKNISLQSVYDSLYPAAKAFSKTWKFLVTTIADITELQDKLIAFYNFSKDFKLKSLSDLYLDLKMVGDARASEFVKSSIETDIASIIYSEDEFGYKRYNVKQSFFPFSGKTPEQIMAIIGGNQVSQFTKVFWANYGQVFDAVELEQAENEVNFYDLNRKKQWEIISAKVEEMMKVIEEEQPEPAMEDINEPDTTDNTDTTE